MTLLQQTGSLVSQVAFPPGQRPGRPAGKIALPGRQRAESPGNGVAILPEKKVFLTAQFNFPAGDLLQVESITKCQLLQNSVDLVKTVPAAKKNFQDLLDSAPDPKGRELLEFSKKYNSSNLDEKYRSYVQELSFRSLEE